MLHHSLIRTIAQMVSVVYKQLELKKDKLERGGHMCGSTFHKRLLRERRGGVSMTTWYLQGGWWVGGSLFFPFSFRSIFLWFMFYCLFFVLFILFFLTMLLLGIFFSNTLSIQTK